MAMQVNSDFTPCHCHFGPHVKEQPLPQTMQVSRKIEKKLGKEPTGKSKVSMWWRKNPLMAKETHREQIKSTNSKLRHLNVLIYILLDYVIRVEEAGNLEGKLKWTNVFKMYFY